MSMYQSFNGHRLQYPRKLHTMFVTRSPVYPLTMLNSALCTVINTLLYSYVHACQQSLEERKNAEIQKLTRKYLCTSNHSHFTKASVKPSMRALDRVYRLEKAESYHDDLRRKLAHSQSYSSLHHPPPSPQQQQAQLSYHSHPSPGSAKYKNVRKQIVRSFSSQRLVSSDQVRLMPHVDPNAHSPAVPHAGAVSGFLANGNGPGDTKTASNANITISNSVVVLNKNLSRIKNTICDASTQNNRKYYISNGQPTSQPGNNRFNLKAKTMEDEGERNNLFIQHNLKPVGCMDVPLYASRVQLALETTSEDSHMDQHIQRLKEAEEDARRELVEQQKMLNMHLRLKKLHHHQRRPANHMDGLPLFDPSLKGVGAMVSQGSITPSYLTHSREADSADGVQGYYHNEEANTVSGDLKTPAQSRQQPRKGSVAGPSSSSSSSKKRAGGGQRNSLAASSSSSLAASSPPFSSSSHSSSLSHSASAAALMLASSSSPSVSSTPSTLHSIRPRVNNSASDANVLLGSSSYLGSGATAAAAGASLVEERNPFHAQGIQQHYLREMKASFPAHVERLSLMKGEGIVLEQMQGMSGGNTNRKVHHPRGGGDDRDPDQDNDDEGNSIGRRSTKRDGKGRGRESSQKDYDNNSNGNSTGNNNSGNISNNGNNSGGGNNSDRNSGHNGRGSTGNSTTKDGGSRSSRGTGSRRKGRNHRRKRDGSNRGRDTFDVGEGAKTEDILLLKRAEQDTKMMADKQFLRSRQRKGLAHRHKTQYTGAGNHKSIYQGRSNASDSNDNSGSTDSNTVGTSSLTDSHSSIHSHSHADDGQSMMSSLAHNLAPRASTTQHATPYSISQQHSHLYNRYQYPNDRLERLHRETENHKVEVSVFKRVPDQIDLMGMHEYGIRSNQRRATRSASSALVLLNLHEKESSNYRYGKAGGNRRHGKGNDNGSLVMSYSKHKTDMLNPTASELKTLSGGVSQVEQIVYAKAFHQRPVTLPSTILRTTNTSSLKTTKYITNSAKKKKSAKSRRPHADSDGAGADAGEKVKRKDENDSSDSKARDRGGEILIFNDHDDDELDNENVASSSFYKARENYHLYSISDTEDMEDEANTDTYINRKLKQQQRVKNPQPASTRKKRLAGGKEGGGRKSLAHSFSAPALRKNIHFEYDYQQINSLVSKLEEADIKVKARTIRKALKPPIHSTVISREERGVLLPSLDAGLWSQSAITALQEEKRLKRKSHASDGITFKGGLPSWRAPFIFTGPDWCFRPVVDYTRPRQRKDAVFVCLYHLHQLEETAVLVPAPTPTPSVSLAPTPTNADALYSAGSGNNNNDDVANGGGQERGRDESKDEVEIEKDELKSVISHSLDDIQSFYTHLQSQGQENEFPYLHRDAFLNFLKDQEFYTEKITQEAVDRYLLRKMRKKKKKRKKKHKQRDEAGGQDMSDNDDLDAYHRLKAQAQGQGGKEEHMPELEMPKHHPELFSLSEFISATVLVARLPQHEEQNPELLERLLSATAERENAEQEPETDVFTSINGIDLDNNTKKKTTNDTAEGGGDTGESKEDVEGKLGINDDKSTASFIKKYIAPQVKELKSDLMDVRNALLSPPALRMSRLFCKRIWGKFKQEASTTFSTTSYSKKNRHKGRSKVRSNSDLVDEETERENLTIAFSVLKQMVQDVRPPAQNVDNYIDFNSDNNEHKNKNNSQNDKHTFSHAKLWQIFLASQGYPSLNHPVARKALTYPEYFEFLVRIAAELEQLSPAKIKAVKKNDKGTTAYHILAKAMQNLLTQLPL